MLQSMLQSAQMDPPRIEQFTGSLIGQCLGDALGSPVEGPPPAVCQHYVEAAVEHLRLPARA